MEQSSSQTIQFSKLVSKKIESKYVDLPVSGYLAQ